MFDIVHDLTIHAPMAKVFSGVSTPVGLDAWWTQSCKGDAALGAAFKLGFGDNYFWMAAVTEFKQDETFALKITDAAADWVDTLVRFELESGDGATVLHFAHAGWAEQSPHFRRSSHCWAMYLRLLRVWCETGAVTPYGSRYFA